MKTHWCGGMIVACMLLAALPAQGLVLEDFESGTPGIFGAFVGDFGVVGGLPESPISGAFSGYLTNMTFPGGPLGPGIPPYSNPFAFSGPAAPTPLLEGLIPFPLAPGTIDGISPSGPGAVEGTVIQSTPFAAGALDTLTFDFNFLSMEPLGIPPDPTVPRGPLNDFAFFTVQSLGLGGAVVGGGAIADVLGTTTVFPFIPTGSPLFAGGAESGVTTATHVFGAADTYVLTIGVMDWGDPFYDSGLVVDNVVLTPVPEPTTLVLLGMGLAGLVARRRGGKN